MADERIQVTLASRADLSGFAAYQAAAKGFGRENKDMFAGLTKSVAGLSASFKNDFTVAVSGAAGVLGEFVRGGLWGLLGAVANQAVGFVVDRFKEAKERAQEFASVLMAALAAQTEQAEANLAAAQKARAEFEETYSRRLGDHSMLQYLASRTVEQLVAEGMSLGKAYKASQMSFTVRPPGPCSFSWSAPFHVS